MRNVCKTKCIGDRMAITFTRDDQITSRESYLDNLDIFLDTLTDMGFI